jgi:hypothetical protein
VRLHFRETIELLVEAIVRHQTKQRAQGNYGDSDVRLAPAAVIFMAKWNDHERASIGSQA